MWKVGEVCRYCREYNTSEWGVGVVIKIQMLGNGYTRIYHVLGDDGILAKHNFIMKLVTK